jgi:hypothetical protein
MGVEHFLVDDEGKNVLGCHKWYDLDPADRANITEAEVLAANEKYPWLPERVVRWMREVAMGRRVRLVTDAEGMYPWTDYESRYFCTRPGWTVYTCFHCGDGTASPGEVPWPPGAFPAAAPGEMERRHAAIDEHIERFARYRQSRTERMSSFKSECERRGLSCVLPATEHDSIIVVQRRVAPNHYSGKHFVALDVLMSDIGNDIPTLVSWVERELSR